MASPAELHGDALSVSGRTANRRRLRLPTPATDGFRTVEVIIHNLSTSGVLVESDTQIAMGEAIEIDLPEAGPTSAAIMWKNGKLHGCQFDSPISQAAVSASQLRAPAEHQPPEATPDGAADGLLPIVRLAIIVGASLALWSAILLILR